MKSDTRCRIATLLAAITVCAPAAVRAQGDPVAIAKAKADSARYPYTAADVLGGSWSAYWYNGVIVSSEIVRGLDILELTPSAFISQNEIDAAKTVHFDYLNAQGQPRLVWPPSFALARAYLDQLSRLNGLASARVSAVRQALRTAENASGVRRVDTLNKLATQLDHDALRAGDAAKVRTLAAAVREVATASR